MFHYTFFFGKMNHLALKRLNFCRIWYVFRFWAITLYFPLRRCLQVSGGHDYLSPTLKRQRKQPRSIEHLFPHETIIRVRISRRIMNCAQWYQKLIVNCERHAFDDEKRLYIWHGDRDHNRPLNFELRLRLICWSVQRGVAAIYSKILNTFLWF